MEERNHGMIDALIFQWLIAEAMRSNWPSFFKLSPNTLHSALYLLDFNLA